MSPSVQRVVAASLLGMLVPLVGCSRGAPATVRTYDAYEGGAPYPNTRPKIGLPSGDFALVPSTGGDTLALVDLGAGTIAATSPVGRDPIRLDGPHQVVVDMHARVAYLALSYPASVQTSGQHSHGNSQLPGWVQAIALDDFRAIGEVRIDPNPGELALSDDGKRLVVTHFDLTAAAKTGVDIDQRRASLAIVDPSAMKPFDTPEPDKLLACVAPHGLALSRPDGKTAFVACYGEDSIAVVNVADEHAPIVRVPLGPNATTTGTPAYGPYGVSLSPDGARVAIGTKDSKEVRFLDVATGAMSPIVASLPGAAYVTAWSPDGKSLYVPTQSEDAIVVVDPATGAVGKMRVFDEATCVAPVDVALGADPSVIYLVCEGSPTAPGAVVTLDSDTLDTRARAVVGAFPGRVFAGRGP